VSAWGPAAHHLKRSTTQWPKSVPPISPSALLPRWRTRSTRRWPRRANNFYNEWPQYKTTLNTAVTQLRDLSSDLKRINADIQAAGGNA
jgi:hypothetical protein